jgi:hypothetical protein
MPNESTPARPRTQADLTGQRFGRLLVVECLPPERTPGKLPRGYRWLCRCDCGEVRIVMGHSLKRGERGTRSCGCLSRDLSRQRKTRLIHGLSHLPEFDVWLNMVERCYNPESKNYQGYGSRGIRVCDRWKESPGNFIEDMGHRPSPKHSIDRIDNDGDYTPENCRWVTWDIQSRNKSSNVYIEHLSLRMTISDWAKYLGLNSQTLYARHKRGWPVERILTSRINRGIR